MRLIIAPVYACSHLGYNSMASEEILYCKPMPPYLPRESSGIEPGNAHGFRNRTVREVIFLHFLIGQGYINISVSLEAEDWGTWGTEFTHEKPLHCGGS